MTAAEPATRGRSALAEALAAAAAGLPVFPLHGVDAAGVCRCQDRPDPEPCGGAGKHPIQSGWKSKATTDFPAVRRMASNHPGCNWGAATGPAAGVWVLDVEAAGIADVEALGRERGAIPPTPTARTGGGGRHYFFRWPADGGTVGNATKLKLGDRALAVDCRGEGGLVVLPPSVSGKGAYSWEPGRSPSDLPFADAPAWALALARKELEAKRPTPAPAPRRPVEGDRGDALKRAAAYLGKVPHAVSGQGGHDRLFVAAQALVNGFRLSDEEAMELLLADYNPRCEPPWSERELLHKVAQCHAHPGDRPRGWLLDADRPEWNPPRAVVNGRHINGTGATNGKAAGGPPPPPPPSGVAAASPSPAPGPPPGWSGPPLPLPTLPPVPPFPLGIFPEPVARFWRLTAESIGVPPDYVAVPGVAVLGAAAGRSREAVLKGDYAKAPALWCVVVAPPSSGKSPALAAAAAPLRKAEQRWRREYARRAEEFEAEDARHKADHDAWRRAGCEGDPPARPAKPVLRQCVLDDATAEAAARVLAANERGVVLVKDELAGLVKALGQYKGGRGGDMEFWLTVWAMLMVKVNRAGDRDAPPLVVPHPFAAVAGAICPDLLPTLRGESAKGDAPADGFIDRFLMSYPDPPPARAETWASVPRDAADEYAAAAEALLRLEMHAEADGDGGEVAFRPARVPFGPAARRAWERFTARLAESMNALDPDDPFRATLGKLREYGLRLAGLMWCLRRVTEPPDEPGAPPEIAGRDVEAAAELVAYFEAHARRCQGVGVTDRAGRVARRLRDWLARRPEVSAFNRNEAFQQLKDRRDVRGGDALNAPLAVLCDYGYVKLIAGDERGGPGRPPQTFEVNPLWKRGGDSGDFRDGFAPERETGPDAANGISGDSGDGFAHRRRDGASRTDAISGDSGDGFRSGCNHGSPDEGATGGISGDSGDGFARGEIGESTDFSFGANEG